MNCPSKQVSLTRLFHGYDRHPNDEQFRVYLELLDPLSPSAVRDGVSSLLRDPSWRRLPPAGQVRARCLRFVPRPATPRKPAPVYAPRAGVAHLRQAVSGALLDVGEGSGWTAYECVRCEGSFHGPPWYEPFLATLRRGGSHAPLLCMQCAGEHLEAVGRRKAAEEQRAWDLLTRISNGYRPLQSDVDWLDSLGFQGERIRRMTSAGMHSARTAAGPDQ